MTTSRTGAQQTRRPKNNTDGGNIRSDNPDFHDWHHLLRDLGWLKRDHALAIFSNHIGILLMIVSFAWGGYLLYRQNDPLGQVTTLFGETKRRHLGLPILHVKV